MAVCATQVHLAPKMAIENPLFWLEKLADHSATISFAPNFFLALVCKAANAGGTREKLNLSSLRVIISGGEANTVSTGMAFNRLVKDMGATTDVLWPAFGMTESCAGSIYNNDFPNLEVAAALDFCCLGQSTHTMQIRITGSDGKTLRPGQVGNLEISGPAVFQRYHNDSRNTSLSLTTDGWFKTGDTGYVDINGNLVLSGRTKDSSK
jgi:acyl-CoA synthetase (AMP-forming)/AMP-acid ligase II